MKFYLTILVLFLFSIILHAEYYNHDPNDSTQYAPIREAEKEIIPLDTGDRNRMD